MGEFSAMKRASFSFVIFGLDLGWGGNKVASAERGKMGVLWIPLSGRMDGRRRRKTAQNLLVGFRR